MALIAKQAGANYAQAEADVVMGLGCAFWERDAWGRPPVWGPPAKQRLIHVDIEPAVIGLNRPADLAVTADAREVLLQLLDTAQRPGGTQRGSDWAASCKDKEHKAHEAMAPMLASESTPIHPLRLIGEIQRFFGSEAVYVVDGGNMALWAHMGIRVGGPRRFLFPMHSGHLGVGLPFALGTKLAHPDRPVVVIHGDGSFMLSCHEAETAARLKLNVIDVIGNDRCWAMVKAGQDSNFEGRHCGVDLSDTRYDLMAQAMGCHAERITRPEEIRPALERAVASNRPAVLDVAIDPLVNLNPPALKSMAAAWLEGCET
jgi:acetolactate synthase-1/2/3 large subunit